MKHIPFSNHDISNPKFLFGRSNLLELLIDHAERLDQIELIGARRFGKTCILKCLCTLLKCEGEHNAYPIYLDLKSHGIKGTCNVYKYISSVIISNLTVDGWLDDSIITYSSISITPSCKWREVYKQFNDISDVNTISDFFENIIEDYSELLEQTFLLLFDEYEYMANSAFDRIDGFMLIREISNKENRPISFWLAGATPWKNFVESEPNTKIGGSGEFNGITLQKFVRPIDRNSFHEMWEYECGSLIEDSLKTKILKLESDVFELTGGIPFYAKSIGVNICVNSVLPDFTSIEGQLVEMEKIFSDNEKKILRDIVRNHKTYSEPLSISLRNLLNYGLIIKDNKNKCSIPFKLYSDYIKAHIIEQQAVKTEMRTIDSLVDSVENLIYTINENYIRNHPNHMFDPSNDTPLQYKYLRTQCVDRGRFSNFIDAIYILHWEGSKENGVSGAKLPHSYKYSMFRRAIDRLRHTFGNAHQTDKLETIGNQLDKGSAIEVFTGSQSEPHVPSDWLNLQENILKQYIEELKKINTTTAH